MPYMKMHPSIIYCMPKKGLDDFIHRQKGKKMNYEIHAPIVGSFEEAKEVLFAILQENQLTVVSDIDVQATLKSKLDKDIGPYHIFGACNAPLADRIIGAEPRAGTLLPCTFVLRETAAGQSEVSFMHPNNVLGLAHNDEVKAVAAIAQEKIEKVIATLHALSK